MEIIIYYIYKYNNTVYMCIADNKYAMLITGAFNFLLRFK
jgi:hypothetical protein